jgi:hypothetical protein
MLVTMPEALAGMLVTMSLKALAGMLVPMLLEALALWRLQVDRYRRSNLKVLGAEYL